MRAADQAFWGLDLSPAPKWAVGDEFDQAISNHGVRESPRASLCAGRVI